ncbi:MAG: class I SAM-dependent methyltransferase [Candidatus Daviesbacteria bacterium]|nr:MAG: class I SAM-dependent methyltransferase [Candidatus Daviesbacteria bacterium]
MSNDLVRQGYNKAAENYSSKRDQFKNNKYLEQLVKLLKPSAIVLDIGCGSGVPVDKYLVNKGFNVIGFDISEKQVELAKANVPKATFEVRDMSKLKEDEYKVDAVISFYAIFHTPREKHQDLFKKINSFLPQGGYILVTMGAGEYEGLEENFHGTKMWWSHYGAEKNKEIVENAGFKILLDEIDIGGNERHQIILAQKI